MHHPFCERDTDVNRKSFRRVNFANRMRVTIYVCVTAVRFPAIACRSLFLSLSVATVPLSSFSPPIAAHPFIIRVLRVRVHRLQSRVQGATGCKTIALVPYRFTREKRNTIAFSKIHGCCPFNNFPSQFYMHAGHCVVLGLTTKFNRVGLV